MNQREILGFPLISFAESSLFNGLRQTPTAFFVSGPLPAFEATGGAGAARSLRLVIGPFVFISVPSDR
jgi:hypothetical protein